MSYPPLIDLKNGIWPVVHLLYGISEWNFTDMLNIKGYIFLVRTVTLTFPVHELSALDWSEKWFLTCSSFTIWSIWMKLHRYVDHQRLHIVTKDVISLSISVLLLFRQYISHKITFGAPSSGGVLCSACSAFIWRWLMVPTFSNIFYFRSGLTKCQVWFLWHWEDIFEEVNFEKFEPVHGISNNVVCATSNASDQPAHMRSLIRAFAGHLNILRLLSYWPNIIWRF